MRAAFDLLVFSLLSALGLAWHSLPIHQRPLSTAVHENAITAPQGEERVQQAAIRLLPRANSLQQAFCQGVLLLWLRTRALGWRHSLAH